MKSPDNESFKEVATRRFYEYFYPKVRNKEIDVDKFYTDFGAGKYVNRSVFLSGLKAGDRNITLDQIQICYEKYQINPDYLLGLTDTATSEGDYVLSEASASYGDDYRKDVGRKLKEIFDKHKTSIAEYAVNRLGMTEQNLYKILRGQGRPYWDQIVTVCEDHGESLDMFRTKPLPKGHLLEQVATLKGMNEMLNKRVKELERIK